jgi:hypothetical protein
MKLCKSGIFDGVQHLCTPGRALHFAAAKYAEILNDFGFWILDFGFEILRFEILDLRF